MSTRLSSATLGAAALLLSGSIWWGASFAQTAGHDAAVTLSADVHTVVNGGYWVDGHREGYLRAIVTEGGTEHVSQELFLQWIEIDADTMERSIAVTVPVEDIHAGSAEGKLIAISRDGDSEFGIFRAEVEVTGTRSETVSRYVLSTGDRIGTYSISAE